ncbi:acetylglutamate kinase [Intestinibaculum porci]|jgi:acetylglutamate kinase|uniref:Acetylglutamate kinase n=1 Tax=Intestinibaculum porci TaxID=2487118 RepID=A0A3G9J3N7_9FIRM|nr:acetylglutamate kinase [Intestinibaculum porci]MDD6350448.1 acetylglutamate kinase [Intestinibaculum porci]MDD6421827.1 acetylglutamate kinase [Intestinibaculum porci]BBH25202.1 acetylglutamate kinase [Intestinibaculum porci]
MAKHAVLKAKILAEAVPYIQEYHDKIVVVKYGGNAMVNEVLIDNVINDVCLMNLVGIKVVLVHGGGPEISKALNKMHIESKFVNGLRYTDEETIDIVQQVLAGKVNKNLVKRIHTHGNKAVGLSGIDNMLLKAKKVESADLGYVGEVEEVHAEILNDVLDKGYIPVVASVGMDEEGHSYNINADTAAAAIASALGAENFVVVSDIPGLLRDKEDENSLISSVTIDDVLNLTKQGIIAGGMIPKVKCITDALKKGVKKAVIIDGRIPHAIIIEIFSDEGSGTQFIK